MNNATLPLSGAFKKSFYLFFFALLSVSFFFQSCSTGIPIDYYSLEQNESLKIDVLNLMKRGGKNFTSVSDDVMNLKNKVNDLISYERDKGEKNLKTVKMWETMMDPNQKLLGGFLNRWETEGKLQGPFIKEAAGVVSKNFDKIIKLESKKKKG